MISNGPNGPDFVDFKINVKVKLSALWAAVMMLYTYGDQLKFYKPGQLDKIISGTMGPLGQTTEGLILGIAVLMSIPAAMVFLSLALKPTVSRWLNIIFGTFFTGIMLLTFLTGAWSYYYYLGVVENIMTVLIIWYAWNWPREGA